jgi:hypothetical protein
MGGDGICGGKVGNSMRAIELLVRVSMVRPRTRVCLQHTTRPSHPALHADWHAWRGAAAGMLSTCAAGMLAHTPTLLTPTLVARDDALVPSDGD